MHEFLISAAFALGGLAVAIVLADSALRWRSAFITLSKERKHD